ncbi:unnamed protein product [Callosobruchus maculatus]|uniref:Uncharacterized protein n=1 Tax=Callosobruchus maculatus TaxID=64391 RepID=A0A653DGU6_CALMS|nr:unnamed protein product [Callosobruchus maculatus]
MEYNTEVQSEISGSEKKSDKAEPKGNKNMVNFPESSLDVKEKNAQTLEHKSIKTNAHYYSDDGMCIDAVGGLKVDLKLKPVKKIKRINKSRSNEVSSLSEDQSVKCFIDVPDYALVGIDGGYQVPF